jgi:uncharacterized protein (TIGR02996 family)
VAKSSVKCCIPALYDRDRRGMCRHRARNRRHDWYRLHAARNPHHDTPDEMTPHDALYAAICAQPDEDTPRLVFADLLEEEGDPARAAFIRKQVALARVPEYDPLWVKTYHFDFNTISGWGVLHTLPKVGDECDWHDYEFRRGFPWKVGVRSLAALVENGDDLFAAAPIQALELDERTRPDLPRLADWPHLARLRRLDFSPRSPRPRSPRTCASSRSSGTRSRPTGWRRSPGRSCSRGWSRSSCGGT